MALPCHFYSPWLRAPVWKCCWAWRLSSELDRHFLLSWSFATGGRKLRCKRTDRAQRKRPKWPVVLLALPPHPSPFHHSPHTWLHVFEALQLRVKPFPIKGLGGPAKGRNSVTMWTIQQWSCLLRHAQHSMFLNIYF